MTYIILGILQGIFEWIPVVALAGQLSSIEFNVIDVALFAHMGTLFAALIYFRKDWLEILTLRDSWILYLQDSKKHGSGSRSSVCYGSCSFVNFFFPKNKKEFKFKF